MVTAKLKPDDRRERIVELVRQTSRVSVEDLAEMMQISRETIRRDLALLSEQGLVRKVHGGAVHLQTALESPLGERRESSRPEKIAIGAAAGALFNEGDSLLIDSGSTTAYFAEELGKVGRFTVITNSTLVASELWYAPYRSDVYLLGGHYYGDGHEVLGPQVVEQIQRLHADHVVLTVGAVSPDGNCMDFNADEAYVARAMIASANRVTVLADSSKIGRHALFQVCDASQIDRLVTDRSPDTGLVNVLRAAGVQIIVAAPGLADEAS